ncbi:MAG: hypothetical protein MHM6MM_009433, partial [Cercozoa sp. M6MM]
FVHDPLANWSITPDKVDAYLHRASSASRLSEPAAKRRRTTSSSTVSSLSSSMSGADLDADHSAQQAIFEVRRTLMGHEEAFATPLSVEEQVRHVVRQATDERNLASLFYGWQSWL